jgi:glycosyltransferase involved in cell wall biosynthesis
LDARPNGQAREPDLAKHRELPPIMIVGALPPPVGGVAIHVERLGRYLRDRGYRVEVFDTASQRTAKRHDQGAGIRVWRGPNHRLALALIVRLLARPRAVLHWHFWPFGLSPRRLWLMSLLSRLAPSVLTIHSGSFPRALSEASADIRAAIRSFCSTCSAVVAVNEQVAEALRDLGACPRHGIRVIPAYIPAGTRSLAGKPHSKTKGLRVLASGYGTRLYGWDVLLPLLDADWISEWHWVTYTVWDDAYMPQVLASAENKAPGRIRLHKDLPSDEFNRLMASCDAFVRPTRGDGDSLAVREALAGGLRVIASDCAPRPRGCTLFRTGDSEDLVRAFLEASNPVETENSDSYAEELEEIYWRVRLPAAAPAGRRSAAPTQGP